MLPFLFVQPEDLALPMLYMPDCLEAIYSLIMVIVASYSFLSV